ncbi:hypothetical protein OA238_c24410 [Octadecabacter arcticus 238]|uniref:Uncharacterized protein n=1 Tax=Octadecabacter arcticus 238 TaxID=391616 RepID=M9RIV6_9RHOB|nr:hypothetical protein [Octadecabacter arcticus]AGI72499.1 hypothetical protein OA238_c24410 [Octadecabacter arcticus 238]
MPNRPTLLAYLNGMPDVESTFPVLARLHKRGKVKVQAQVYSKLLRKEPRLARAFHDEGFMPEPMSKWRMKLFYKKDINAADAVLTIADPNWDSTTRKQRGAHIRKTGQQSIFLQHGAYQLGINGSLKGLRMNYYSQKILLWEELGENIKFIEEESAERGQVVGFTKKNTLPRKTWGPEVNDWVARHPKRLLVCQSFRWGMGRYSDNSIAHFYNLMDALLSKHPDVGIVIRSHRGKVRKNHRNHDKILADTHPNVMFSHYYSGPLAKASIHDAIDLCDAMISPTSTTVLDCIYSGKPAAVFAEGLDIFGELQQISDQATIEAFIGSLDKTDPVYQKIRTRFGSLDENLDRAAKAIEDYLFAIRTVKN